MTVPPDESSMITSAEDAAAPGEMASGRHGWQVHRRDQTPPPSGPGKSSPTADPWATSPRAPVSRWIQMLTAASDCAPGLCDGYWRYAGDR